MSGPRWERPWPEEPRDRRRRRRSPVPPARLGGLRSAALDLVRLPARVPVRAWSRRPQPHEGVRERLARPRHGAGDDAPRLRADPPEPRRVVVLPEPARVADVLDVGVRGRRPRAALRVPAPARVVQALPELDPRRERARPY